MSLFYFEPQSCLGRLVPFLLEHCDADTVERERHDTIAQQAKKQKAERLARFAFAQLRAEMYKNMLESYRRRPEIMKIFNFWASGKSLKMSPLKTQSHHPESYFHLTF